MAEHLALLVALCVFVFTSNILSVSHQVAVLPTLDLLIRCHSDEDFSCDRKLQGNNQLQVAFWSSLKTFHTNVYISHIRFL